MWCKTIQIHSHFCKHHLKFYKNKKRKKSEIALMLFTIISTHKWRQKCDCSCHFSKLSFKLRLIRLMAAKTKCHYDRRGRFSEDDWTFSDAWTFRTLWLDGAATVELPTSAVSRHRKAVGVRKYSIWSNYGAVNGIVKLEPSCVSTQRMYHGTRIGGA